MVTIESSSDSKVYKLIIEEPIMEMTSHIRPLYEVHFKGKLMSNMLIDNGFTINIMSSIMLGALGKNISDLIDTEVSIYALIRKSLRLLGFSPWTL